MLLCLLPLWLFACKAPDRGSYAPEPDYAYEEDYGSGYGGGGGYDEDEAYDELIADYEMAEEAPPAPVAAERSVRSRGRFKAKKKDMARNQAVTETVAPADPVGGEGSTEPLVVEAPANEEPAPVAQQRQIIYTATMRVGVYDLDAALARVEELPARYGGWTQQRIDNQFVLRIPAAKLDEVMELVGELGVIEQRLLEALDVTAEYTDLESRIRVLTQMQAQLQTLLAQAKNVEQALEIRRALDAITLELEAARAQIRALSESISFSTLIVQLVERGPGDNLPSSNDPFPWVDSLGVEATDYR